MLNSISKLSEDLEETFDLKISKLEKQAYGNGSTVDS